MRRHSVLAKIKNLNWQRAVAAGAALYVLALTVPGVFLRRVSSTLAFVVGQDYHYSVTFGASLRLLLDPSSTLAAVKVNFGFLFTLLAAGAADLFHVHSFGDWLRLVQGFQFVFLICAVASAWVLERNRWLVIAVALSAAPWLSTMNQAIVAPTSSGLRFLNFALLPFALAAVKSLNGARAAAVAGVASAVFFLWNPETGIVCAAALVFFIFVREFAGSASLGKALGLICLAAVVASAAIIAALVLMLGDPREHWLFLQQLIGHVNGYNGHELYPDPIALICALYASSVVIYCCFAVRAGSADSATIVRAAFATAALVWFAYYAHKPGIASLVSIVFLLSFTLGPILNARPIYLSAFVWLVIAAVNVTELASQPARFSHAPPTFQGTILPAEATAYLNDHAAQLKNAPKDIIYFSSTPFSMALATGRTNPLSVFDPFGETWTEESFRQLRKEIDERRLSCILIESADSPLLAVSPPRAQFMRRIQQAIAQDFKLRSKEGGWDFWCRPAS